MHWMLQDNLINPDTRDHVRALLEARKVPYTLVRLVPFFHLLDNEVEDPVGPVFAYGSTGLGVVARTRGWQPGYFDDNLDYELMLAKYGELALNAGSLCGQLDQLEPTFDRFFVRPVLDTKSFAGTVMTRQDFEDFRDGVAKVSQEKDVTLRPEDRIVLAPLTDIRAEYRLFVIGGQVVTGSRYKLGDRVHSSAVVPGEVAAFAQACADHWSPNAAYTLDIADTPVGLKVIETNSANSAGFYACDVGAIIDAVLERLS